MATEKFDQPSLSIQDQLNLLKQRRLNIPDTAQAEHFLKTIGYYRLKAYFKPFILNSNSENGFKPKASFTDILRLYNFDREYPLWG